MKLKDMVEKKEEKPVTESSTSSGDAPKKEKMSAEELKAKMAAAAERIEKKAEVKRANRPRPQAQKMGKTKFRKVLGFGLLGSGKTFLMDGPLECGERVFVASADFGGNGLVSVENAFAKKNLTSVYEANIMNVNLGNYQEVIEFLDQPLLYAPDINDFDPTVLFFDGFSTFNNDYIDEYSEDPDSGFRGIAEEKYGHWYDVKRATLRCLRKFFAFTLPNGKELHKIMTTLQAKPDTNEMTQKTEVMPMIQGGAKEFTVGGFDVVLNCFREEDETGKEQFFYRFGGDGTKYAVKNRGFDLKGKMPADPVKLWKVLTGIEV